MKLRILSMIMLLAAFTVSAQVATPASKEQAPAPTVVKKSSTSTTTTTTKTTPQKQSSKAVAPSNQKKPVTPVKPSVVPNKTTPVATPKDITGFWLTATKASIIQFNNDGGVYNGKIVWHRQKTDKNGKLLNDVNNPDKSKRKNPLVGSMMITNLKYNPKTNTYEGGKAYMPQTGTTYNCKARLKGDNTLEVTAMAGIMSKTLVWTRTTGVPSR